MASSTCHITCPVTVTPAHDDGEERGDGEAASLFLPSLFLQIRHPNKLVVGSARAEALCRPPRRHPPSCPAWTKHPSSCAAMVYINELRTRVAYPEAYMRQAAVGCDVRQARQLRALVSFPRHFACHYAATVSKLLGSSESNERAPDDDGP
uniref:Uncharacterized protein n=1 Tax=Oryza glaberrima TaxID=4538 RepID=I1PBY4_ORYGL